MFIFKNTIDVQWLDNIETDTFESLHLLVATRRTSQTFQLLIIYRPPVYSCAALYVRVLQRRRTHPRLSS